MTYLPPVVSEAEWRAAREALLVKEKEFNRTRDALNAQRRNLPMIRIEKPYTFEGPDGAVSLLDLFAGRRQLLVYHFMFDPSWEEGCQSCSFMLDNVGHISHLHARSTELVAISRAPLNKLNAYKERMGWSIPWYSSFGSDFNYDFHATLDPSVAPVEYNYTRRLDLPADIQWPVESHGVSAFLLEGDEIFHTYSTYARGADMLVSTYHWLDLTALGRQEDWEQPSGRSDGPPQSWLRRHDRYAD